MTYDSFGNVIFEKDPTVETRYQFTGREFDEETGLYYYRARFYDSQAGRFIGEDPIGLEGGLNLYAYVGNSPIEYIDPFGEVRRFDPSHPDCIELARKIKNIQKDIEKRLRAIEENPLNLPEICPGGRLRDDVRGHRKIVRDQEKNLEEKMKKYMDMCGGNPPGVPVAKPVEEPADESITDNFREYIQDLIAGAQAGTLTAAEWAVLIGIGVIGVGVLILIPGPQPI